MIVSCLNCEKEFEKTVTNIKRSPNNYCSRSCAASANNRANPRRVKTKECKQCSTKIFSNYTYCNECKYYIQDYTLSEIKYDKYNRASAYALVRSRSRAIGKNLGWNSCVKCGYDKHVEIAHIKSVSEFSEDTLVSVVNDPSNLIALCPNCHWEFDHPN